MAKGITKRSEDYARWYTDVIAAAELADHSAVRGCMVIRPTGYAIWEKMQRALDNLFKETGHENAYFPLFIPKSYLSKEADHVEGFAKECAVITHYRLKNAENGSGLIVDPDAKLEEELIIRPTSETIIWNTYKNWIQSYRDLPILINQWANVVRWEMRTRLFLRTAEFLWQEGHTAHATYDEAEKETRQMLEVYKHFAEEYMAVPVIPGLKTENEKFAGALHTYCIEAMMQDGKALQAGTSHNLGQNFAKAFDVSFQNENGELEHVWATSWGVSTRLVGALIMTHSDDNGLVLPPKLAKTQVVVIPIWKSDEEMKTILGHVDKLAADWKGKFDFKIDDRNNLRPGRKFNEWEKKGIPIRIEMGPKDLEAGEAVLVRRDTCTKERVPQEKLTALIPQTLEHIQKDLYKRALEHREKNTHVIDDYDEFKQRVEAEGGFYLAHWDGTTETELRLQEETKATIRCIPLDAPEENGKCLVTGKPSTKRVIIARAY